MDWLTEYPEPGGDYGFGSFTQNVGCAVANGIFYAALQSCDLWPLAGLDAKVLLPDCSSISQWEKPDTVILKPEAGFGYVEAVEAIRRETEGDIWLMGDQEMISVFMERGMIDEVTLNVVPVMLGNGYKLFSRNRAEHSWKMICYNCFTNGVMQLCYTSRNEE